MHVEDILKDVGGFGLYQKILVVVFLVPASIVIPWFSMNMIFMTSTPDHWCNVPEVANSNLSLDLQKLLIRPLKDPSCSRYDVNYSQILDSGNYTIDTKWPTKPCSDGWQYDTSDYDATAVSRWNMVCHDSHYSSLALSLVFMGHLFGSPLYGFMSDRCGRKPTFFFLAVLIAVTEISSVFSPNFALFLVLRLLNGSAVFSIYSVAFVIATELVTSEIRTRINMLTTTCWTIGLCLLSLIAWLTANWIWLSVVTSASAVTLLMYTKLLPESSSWLITQGYYEEAAAIMTKISETNGQPIIHQKDKQLLQKIQEMGKIIQEQKNSEVKISYFDFFKYPVLRKNFLLLTVCFIGNTIPYYGLQVYAKNLHGSMFLNFFFVSIVELPAHFITWISMERFGRRCSAVCGFAISAIACLMTIVIPSGYMLKDIICSLIAKAGAAATFMIVFQQVAELLPTSHRSTGMGMINTVGVGSTLLVPYIVYLVNFGPELPFLVFSLISFSACICSAFVPETLNSALPQTICDAERFRRDCKLCSCVRKVDSSASTLEIEKNCWTPARLSAEDLVSSPKHVTVLRQEKDTPILQKCTPLSSNV